MSHYKSNLRDIEFNLFEVLRRQDLLGQPPYDELDKESVRSILGELERMATGPLAESFADADRNPPVFDPATIGADPRVAAQVLPCLHGRRVVPALAAGRAGGDRDAQVAELGHGQDDPRLQPVHLDVRQRAYHGQGAVGPRHAGQKRFAEQAIEPEWGATMVLTEPDAGSDVGAGWTRAIEQLDGTWHIEGVKRFITSAEHDLADNIFHLVLARPEGPGPGTKGLSMFLVPKYLVNEDGTLGERNGVQITNVEHKMGLKASTTCEVTFGAEGPRWAP